MTNRTPLKNLWNEATAKSMNESELLLYRSNLLGSDQRITNYGGGNTSGKIMEQDPLTGKQVEVLWVKGSGGDLGSMKLDGLATLYMEKLMVLKSIYKGVEFEDEMVSYLPHCTFNLNPRAASIDTPLHALIPKKHVDHMHPDAIIAIATSQNSEKLTQEIFGKNIGWLPWKRPGFELGLWLEKFCAENPNAKGVILESHGLFTWEETSYECYQTTLSIINQATVWLEEQMAGKQVFGGEKIVCLASDQRKAMVSYLMPVIRGLISTHEYRVGHFDDSEAVLEFVNSQQLHSLAKLGTSCPDHFLRTKICPLVIDFDSTTSELEQALMDYRQYYQSYYERCHHQNSPAMRDANPIIYLIPGVGLLAFAKDKATARISSEFYINAIHVMRGASSISKYCALPEQEAFDIEYWLLEEAKLQRMPKPKKLAGRIAFITGGAGGIGTAIAKNLLTQGACVVLADIDEQALASAKETLSQHYSADVVRSITMDVTDEVSIQQAFAFCLQEFGGLDILVSNAGMASSAPIEQTSLQLWNQNMNILSTGYFLVSREAFLLFKTQGLGGTIAFVASKNALTPSKGAAAYCVAKSSEVHLARCLALEGAEEGIRVNVINPDAVLRDSKIWSGDWRQERKLVYGTENLEELYRNRSLLKRSVFPEDVAEAVYFFVSDLSSKSTGNIINVDAGNIQTFTR